MQWKKTTTTKTIQKYNNTHPDKIAGLAQKHIDKALVNNKKNSNKKGEQGINNKKNPKSKKK